MAAAQAREATPPPVIGKAGSYTVFLTPPATPKPSEARRSPVPSPGSNPSSSPRKAAPLTPKSPPSSPPSPPPPPVQVPPLNFEKPRTRSSGSAFGFFWDAVAKVQDVHSSLDEYLANWLGLDQSKYQWALNDYYENKGVVKESGKAKGLVNKRQVV